MLIDSFERKINYLRISVTDKCNLRCVYCMPEEGIIHKPRQDLLSFEEIAKIVEIAARAGIEKVRLTGGEPLLRNGLLNLVESLSRVEGIDDISLTTNGILLKEYAFKLKKAGLKRVNVSLDTLNKDKYSRITRNGNLEKVLDGINEALKAGLTPLKINVLLLGNTNQDEIADFLRLSIENPLHVRFLEFMPINQFFVAENCVSCREVMEIAERFGAIEEAPVYGNGPAKTYRFKNSCGTFGMISPLSDKFCFQCNRLRLTSDGFLKSCLHYDSKVNLREPLRRGAGKEELIALIKLAAAMKPKEHYLDKPAIKPLEYSMCQIGG